MIRLRQPIRRDKLIDELNIELHDALELDRLINQHEKEQRTHPYEFGDQGSAGAWWGEVNDGGVG